MSLLLDTNVLLWWLSDSRRINAKLRGLITNGESVVYVSAASIWECRIKESLGKLSLPGDFAAALEAETFEHLPVTAAHAHMIAKLPNHHRDPFDRMLIAQAQVEQLTIVSSDPAFTRYSVALIRA